MNNDKPFDLFQCSKDGWRCQYFHLGRWLDAFYHGKSRCGGTFICLESDSDSPFVTPCKIRNIANRKPVRMIHVATVPAEFFKEGHLGSYSFSVPLTCDSEGHPIVDHSDAIIKALERLKDYDMDSGDLTYWSDKEIDRIKKERGDE